MPRLKVFSVYDSKVGAFLQPFIMKTKGEALRGWSDVVNDPNTQFHKHPEDYSLFEIAEWDEDSGKYENHLAPISLGLATEVKFGDLSHSPKIQKPEKKEN